LLVTSLTLFGVIVIARRMWLHTSPCKLTCLDITEDVREKAVGNFMESVGKGRSLKKSTET